jgi:outer membrane receptor protein involved in Fe transport
MGDRPLVYSPYLVVDTPARAQFGVQNFWYQEPKGYSLHARISKYYTKHSIKAGTEIRLKRGVAARYYYADLRFVARETANVWVSPNSRTGHPWASFLLGAMDPAVPAAGGAANSNVRYNPPQLANTEMYGFYVQDDFRVFCSLIFNLGLRYEYQGGLWDPENRFF